MSRQKLSEYRAKKIISNVLGMSYVGWSVTNQDISAVHGYARYVVKVDQAVKGRFKKGLVLLDVPQSQLRTAVKSLARQGYQSFLIEPHIEHQAALEQYVALTRDRSGYQLAHSRAGGVDIEAHQESIASFTLDESCDWGEIAERTGLTQPQLRALLEVFKSQYCTLIEINPYLVTNEGVVVLDSAIEVDDAGTFFAEQWAEEDIRTPKLGAVSPAERAVRTLDANSPASFNLSVLNPDGAIFLLLSGGGASVVVADEIYNCGLGKLLANYGEYSGNPTSEEARIYTAQVLQLMAASNAPRKVLFIGGAVANFTDIANTFSGVIAAIDECADILRQQEVKIYVRRGGPRQEIGLRKIHDALERHGLLGGVYDPTTSITDALNTALKEVK